jgi:hypothetical protein
MKLRTGVVSAVVLACIAGCSSEDGRPTATGSAERTTSPAAVKPAMRTYRSVRGETRYYGKVDDGAAAGPLRNLHKQTDENGIELTGTPLPGVGLGASDLEDAYGVAISGGPLQTTTVAVIGGQDDPNLESDLNVYRTMYGLPPCTTANGCFRKVNENGQASPLSAVAPTSGITWATELANDVEMVSALCPSCHIVVVEWQTAIEAAWQTAVNLGAKFVSNSFIYGERSTDENAAYFNSASFFAGGGDNGFGNIGWPSTSARVTSVGGTNLGALSAAPWWSQSAWGGTGSGCSAIIPRPSWQTTDYGCGAFRTVDDVSAVANDVVIYDSWSSQGWVIGSGTSISTPLVAALYADRGWTGAGPSFSYSNPALFTDVTTGSDGSCFFTPALCNAQAGYDGPTGNGTPIGPDGTHQFWAVPNALTMAAGTFTNVQLFWSTSDAVTPLSCWVVPQSLPAGVTASCIEYSVTPYTNGETMQIQVANTVQPQTFVATVVSKYGNVERSAEVVVDVTSCVPATCSGADACNTSISDGCGGTLSCGACTGSGQSCFQNKCCVHEPASVVCSAQGACGILSDGCGGTVDCGACPGPLKCPRGEGDCGGYCCRCRGTTCM